MSGERPRFRRREHPPDITRRVTALAALLLIAVVLLSLRWWWLRRIEGQDTVVIEVSGEVPDPGFHPVSAPARVHAALTAAGADPEGFVDAELEAGTRLVVEEGGRYRLERMDDLLVFGLPIDVNTASETALDSIPGIGPARAAAIIAEREENGPFSTIDDLARVRGIGPKTVDELRPFVTVAP